MKGVKSKFRLREVLFEKIIAREGETIAIKERDQN